MFAAASAELIGGFMVSAPVDAAFGLFSPEGERLWVPGWAPELLHPRGAAWEQGLIFRTQEELGEAVWVVTALDHQRHAVEYYRVEPGRYVARVRVSCQAKQPEQTEVAVTYTFVGLSDAGNRDIGAMSRAAYEEKMMRWEEWISAYLHNRQS
jgi:hypothetical protein